MKKPNRVGMNVLDDELIGLINASAKIFPITQDEVDGNINHNGYEYGRVGNHIYRWESSKWGYIIADDMDIDWEDVKGKPTAYIPLPHDHDRLHEHINKELLDSIKNSDVILWNSVSNKAEKEHAHPYASEEHNHNTMYYQKSEVDVKFENIPEASHNHDGRYYKKSEVDSKLITKSDTNHTHDYAPSTHSLDSTIHVTLEDKANWDDKSPFKYEDEFVELRDHYGYMPINGGGFDGQDGYYLMYDGGVF